MNAPARKEIHREFETKLQQLQWRGEGYDWAHNRVFKTFGIAYVPDPYEPRKAK